MPASMPVLFVSHGAPDALLRAPDTLACWRAIAERVPEPRAILTVSAHWQARVATASQAEVPATIHDFAGFAPELHRRQYPAPGAPEVAEQAIALLTEAGIAAELDRCRGLDHGAWVPLSTMYADACLPVTQLSLTYAGPAAHLALGRALAPLRDAGVLIVASGAITHNFAWLDFAADGQEPLPAARVFADWVATQLATGNVAALLDYRSTPDRAAAHPSEEHLLPLFVALGAAGDVPPERFTPAYTYGALAMDAYLWPSPREPAAVGV